MTSTDDVIAKFRLLDQDGSGTIEEEELRSFLGSISGETFSQGNINALFAASDTNKDGKIHLEEFLNFVMVDAQTPSLPPALYAKFKAALSQLSITENASQGTCNRRFSGESRILQLRKEFKLESIPDWLETLVTQYHLKNTPLSSGHHELKLTRIVPFCMVDGIACLLCLLSDFQRNGVSDFLYSFRDNMFSSVDIATERVLEAETALPKELQAWCQLCVASGGRPICLYSKALQVLNNSRLIGDVALSQFANSVREQMEFATLEEIIFEIVGASDLDDDMKSYLARAREEPEKVWSELKSCFGHDAELVGGEPDLSIDWIVGQLFP